MHTFLRHRAEFKAAGRLKRIGCTAAAFNGLILLRDLHAPGRYAPVVHASVRQTPVQLREVSLCGQQSADERGCVQELSPRLTQPVALLTAADALPVSDSHERIGLLLRARDALDTPEALAVTQAMQRILADECRFQAPF